MKPPSYDGDRGKWNGPAKLPLARERRKLNDVARRNTSWGLQPDISVRELSCLRDIEIQLLGDPIGSPLLARTETLVVQPGQYIEWTLETDLRRSSVGVY